MPIIEINTIVKAPIQIVFDLSRSIDLHKISTAHTHEEAIDGVTEGLIELNKSVTWRAKHFGIYQKLTSRITEYNRPAKFTDEMVEGAFAYFKHEHIFSEGNGQTEMKDVFNYKSPLGILGRIADSLFLKKYMTRLLVSRNQTIKEFAENDQWKEVLKH